MSTSKSRKQRSLMSQLHIHMTNFWHFTGM